MSPEATSEDHLVLLLTLCLNFTWNELWKRDRARAERVMEKIRGMFATAKAHGGKPPVRLMIDLARRKDSLPPEETTWGLVMAFDTVFLILQHASREAWPGLVDLCLARLSKPVMLSSARLKDLKEEIRRKRTPRQAALAILQAAGRGDPLVISTRLQRAGHRVTSRRRPKR